MPARDLPRTVIGLVRACHPGPTAVVTLTASTLSIAAGRGGEAVWVGSAVLAGQLSVGWSNDFLDRERDREARRVTKPAATGNVSERLIASAALIALLSAVAFSFMSGWRAAIAHLAGVAAAWGYNFGLKGTSASPVPYAIAFGLLPAFVTLGLPGHPWPAWWVTVAGALLGAAAHFTNVLPDVHADIAAGIRGLPHRIGERRSRFAAAGLLAVASLLLIAAPGAPRSLTSPSGDLILTGFIGVAIVLGTLAVAAARIASGTGGRGKRVPGLFGLTVIIAVADVALLIARGTSIAP